MSKDSGVRVLMIYSITVLFDQTLKQTSITVFNVKIQEIIF